MNSIELERNCYLKKINEYETNTTKLSQQDASCVLAMQQIVREGYKYFPDQYKIMDKDKVLKRLDLLIKKNKLKALPAYDEELHYAPKFEETEKEIQDFCKTLKIKTTFKTKDYPEILKNICEYTKFATKNEACFVFLLRDMFLPYLITKNIEKKDCYPLLFGRKILKYFYSHTSNIKFDFDECDDDKIYLEFLEIICFSANKHSNFDDFFKELKPKFLKLIKQNNDFFVFTKNLLKQIEAKKIIVVESGRFGTIPLILKCIDSRIDFRLFATGPEMYDIYKDKLFTKKGIPLEMSKLVDLEKSICQNEMFVFSSIKDNQIMIKKTSNKKVLSSSYDEIAYTLNLYENKKTCS